jgi:predicted metal-dependent enzyme (double-stranded beta helix superfamily)
VQQRGGKGLSQQDLEVGRHSMETSKCPAEWRVIGKVSEKMTYSLKELCEDLAEDVEALADEHALTPVVARRLNRFLAEAPDLPAEVTRPHPEHYVMYPLYVDPDGKFSVAAAVWNVGQYTPVHGHETWGVVGIYSGVEREQRYVKPAVANVPLQEAGTAQEWQHGEVTICCTTDDDVHMVACASQEPCVGIHIYGRDIGTLSRRTYDVDSGDVGWFVSKWAVPGETSAT